jgi:hypothetical protein
MVVCKGGLTDKWVNQWGLSEELGSTKEQYLVMYMVLQFKSETNADWDHIMYIKGKDIPVTGHG